MREISEAYQTSFPEAPEEDLVSGIFQSIGYKEFAPLPTAQLTAAAKDLPAFKEAIERMKISTRQYAKSQVKWIAGKLKDTVDERVTAEDEGLFLLDATGESLWRLYYEQAQLIGRPCRPLAMGRQRPPARPRRR